MGRPPKLKKGSPLPDVESTIQPIHPQHNHQHHPFIGGNVAAAAGLIPIDRSTQNFPVPPNKDHFLYNSLYNRDVEFMKNLIRSGGGSGGSGAGSAGPELDRHPNLHMQYSEFDHHRSLHDQCPPGMEHQQQLFACGTGPPPHMLPLVTRSFSGLGDYPSETIKQHCKSEKHDDETVSGSAGKCQMHSNNSPADGGRGILVKTEFNEMQQSKSSPVHEAFEMTSNAFTSNVHGTGQFHHDHHDSGSSPPLPLMESTSSNVSHQHQQHQHQCSPHSYESYLYASGSGSGPSRVGLSARQGPGTLSNNTGVGSEVSGSLFHCKSFFADNGSGTPGMAGYYPNSQSNNGDSGRGDDSASCGYSASATREAEEKVVKAIKARKMSD